MTDPDAAQNLEAVHVGHVQVEHDRIRRVELHFGQRDAPVGGVGQLQAGIFPESRRDHSSHDRGVVDDHHADLAQASVPVDPEPTELLDQHFLGKRLHQVLVRTGLQRLDNVAHLGLGGHDDEAQLIE